MYNISTITSLLEPEFIEWMAKNSKSNAFLFPITPELIKKINAQKGGELKYYFDF